MIASYVYIHSLIAITLDKCRDRLERDERGQTSAEYIGLIIVVVAICAAVATNNGTIAKAIGDKLKTAIDSIKTA